MDSRVEKLPRLHVSQIEATSMTGQNFIMEPSLDGGALLVDRVHPPGRRRRSVDVVRTLDPPQRRRRRPARRHRGRGGEGDAARAPDLVHRRLGKFVQLRRFSALTFSFLEDSPIYINYRVRHQI